MGTDELVLKIPSTAKTTVPVTGVPPSPPAAASPSSATSSTKPLTHSRESSGASVKFVSHHHHHHPHRTKRGSGGGRHRRESSCGGISSDGIICDDGDDGHVVILGAGGSGDCDGAAGGGEEEDDHLLTSSDRLSLSPDSVEVVIDDVGGERMLRPPPSGSGGNDSKSQNSDYGSFCNTPCDMNAAAAAAVGATANAASNGHQRLSAAAPGSGGAGSGGGKPDPDEGHADEKEEDSSMLDGYQRQPLLNSTAHHDSCSSDDEAGGTNSSGYTRRKSRHPRQPPQNDSVRIDVEEDDATSQAPLDEVDDADSIPAEPLKTLVAFVFLFFAWIATTTSLALTHDRLPDYKPLPDVFLDNVHYQPWGLDASEIIIMVAVTAAFTLIVFHRHRFVVFRRIFFIGGLHYFYRAITMYVTVLPKSDTTYKCAPKANHTTFAVIFGRVFELLSGMGLSINEKHYYCGDYIYSGHTMTLVMTFLIIREYSPKRWFLLHWLAFCTTLTGVICLLVGYGHYTIDVVIAYWVTTRVWWIYHTMANTPHLLTAEGSTGNYMLNIWWMCIFKYFEGNVGRPLPKGFNFPWPKRLTRYRPDFLTPARSRRGRRRDADEETGGDSGNGASSSNQPPSRLP